ncbi:rCG37022 [Rattus norvegicus]|uniref:RCG37022 n=1 Tax=Rattus norvegicus TaxID=10116 RepID=A6HTY3_RAT|nr:rCG37022 [Rattus norvegicus]
MEEPSPSCLTSDPVGGRLEGCVCPPSTTGNIYLHDPSFVPGCPISVHSWNYCRDIRVGQLPTRIKIFVLVICRFSLSYLY